MPLACGLASSATCDTTKCPPARVDVDFYGHDLLDDCGNQIRLLTASCEQSCSPCQAHPECRTFTFDEREQYNVCYLKDANGRHGATGVTGTQSGDMSEAPGFSRSAARPSSKSSATCDTTKCPPAHVGVDFSGHDLFDACGNQNPFGTSYEECCSRCQAHPECRIFTWGGGQVCNLKDAAGPHGARGDPGCQSGDMSEAPGFSRSAAGPSGTGSDLPALAV